MGDNTRPFSAEQASRRVAGRGAAVDRAVASQTESSNSSSSSSTRSSPKAQDMGGAPRGSGQRSYGAPIQSPMVRMRNGQTTDNSQ